MARTATLGVAGFLLSVVFVLASLWWIPDSARASTPLPPGPVDEIADIPSRLFRASTGSPLGDSIVSDYMKAQNALIAIKRAQDAAAAAAAAPKPITAPAAFSRAGGSVLTAAMAAWALGSNGTIALVGVATGEDYGTVFCQQPDWYQATTSFVNMGFAPDCTSAVLQPNEDIPDGMTPASYGGFVMTYTHTSVATPQAYCYTLAGTRPAGMTVQWLNLTSGSWDGFTVQSPGNISSKCGSTHYGQYTVSHAAGVRFSLGGNVVSQMVERYDDPERTVNCRIVWDDGSITTGTGIPYRESDGVPISASGLGCEEAYVSQPGRGPGLMPSRITVESEDDAGAITEISDAEVPDFAPDERKAFETGNGRGLVLEKVVGTTVRSCMTWDADCVGWWEDTASGTSPTVGTATYRCTYAGAVIALAECGAYRYTFDVQTQTPTITDPSTGQQIPWSSGSPSWSTITPTVTGGGACGAAWSWNPVDWVLNPLKCAFVPSSAAVQTSTAAVETAWQGSWPVKGMQAATAALTAIQGVSLDGCSGPHVYFELTWPAPIVWDTYPLNACQAPYDFLAFVSRTLGSLLLIGYTAWGVTRRVGSVVSAPGVGPA